MGLAGEMPPRIPLCGYTGPRTPGGFLDLLRTRSTFRRGHPSVSARRTAAQSPVVLSSGKKGICGRLLEKKLANRLWSVPFSFREIWPSKKNQRMGKIFIAKKRQTS